MSDDEFDRRSLLKLGAAAPLFGVEGIRHRLTQQDGGSEDGTDASDGSGADGSDGGSTDEGWTQPGHDAGRTYADPDDRGPTVDTVLQWRGNDLDGYSGELPVGDFLIADGVLYSTNASTGYGSAVDVQTAELIWVVDVRDRYANVPKRDDYRRIEPSLGRQQDGSLEENVDRPVVGAGVLASLFKRERDADGNKKLGVIARDTKTGDVLWKKSVKIDNGVDWRGGPLTAAGETLLIVGERSTSETSFTGKVIALDITTGDTKWVREFGPAEDRTEISTPVANEDAAFVTVGFGTEDRNERPEATYSLDLADGTTRWESAIHEHEPQRSRSTNTETTYSYNSFYGAAVRDGTLYVPGRGVAGYREGGNEITAVNTADGSRRWRISREGLKSTDFAVSDDGLYVTQRIRGEGEFLIAYDLADGSERWRIEGRSYSKPPVVAGGIVYGPGFGLHAYDTETGERLWQETGYGLDTCPERSGATCGYGDGYQIADGAIYTTQGGVSRYVTPPARLITEPVIAVAGRQRTVGVTLQNTTDGPLPGITVEAQLGSEDGPLSDLSVSGVPDRLAAGEETVVDVTFTVAEQTSGAGTVKLQSSGRDTPEDTELLEVEVQRPFSLTARYPEAAGRVVAGRSASLGLTVECNDRLAIEDVAVEVRLSEVGGDGEWRIANQRARSSEGAVYDAYPDAGEWRNFDEPGTDPVWRLDRLPPGGRQFPSFGAIPPDGLDPGTYTLTVVGYEDAAASRTEVGRAETEFALEQVYVTAGLEPPGAAIDEGETGTVDIRVDVLDDPIDAVQATVDSLPAGLTAAGGSAEGGEYSREGGSSTWSWGATDSLTTLRGSLEVAVESGSETGKLGGTFGVTMTVTGQVSDREDTIDRSVSGSISVLGLDGYGNQKRRLANTLDEWKDGELDEQPAVDSLVDDIIRRARSGGLEFEPARKSLERLVYSEQVTKRTLRVLTGFEGGNEDLAFTYEIAPRTATAGVKAFALAALGGGAGVALKKGGVLAARRSDFLAEGAKAGARQLDKVYRPVAWLLSTIRSGIRSLASSFMRATPRQVGRVMGLLKVGVDETLTPDLVAGAGASDTIVSTIEDTFSGAIDLVADLLLAAVPLRSQLNAQLQVSQPAQLGDGLAGDQAAAKSAKWAAIDQVTRDARYVDGIIDNATDLPFDEAAGAIVEAFSFDSVRPDELVELVTNIVDAVVALFEALRNLVIGGPAAAGLGVGGILMTGGNFRRGTDAIRNGTTPSFNYVRDPRR